jgi:hypothetical protein
MLRGLLFLAVTLTLIATFANAADEKKSCQLVKAASLDMAPTSDNRFTVPITIDGKSYRALVDTADNNSLISVHTALGLSGASLRNAQAEPWSTYGRVSIAQWVTIGNVDIGGLQAPKFTFGILPVVEPPEIEAVLAGDILRHYDVEIDPAGHKLNLFSKSDCGDAVAYWAKGPVAVLSFEQPNEWDPPLISVTLDGKEFKATFDTSAPNTSGDWARFQYLFDLDDKSAGLKTISGAGGDSALYKYPFKVLSLEGIAIANPDILLGPKMYAGEPNDKPYMRIGMDLLRQFHIYIANGDKKIYMTPVDAR